MKKLLYIFLICFTINQQAFSNQWIVFYSQEVMLNPVQRPHAFATFYQTDPVTKMPVEIGSWGFHPIKGWLQRIIGPGGVSSSEGAVVHNWFIAEVSEKEFNLGISLASKWKYETYNLFTNNCVSFVRDILKEIKILDVPPSEYQTPAEVITMLKVQNQAWEEHSVLSYNFFVNYAKSQWENYTYPDKSFKLSYPKYWEFLENFSATKAFVLQRNKKDREIADAAVGVRITPISSNDEIVNLKANIKKAILSQSKAEIIKLEDRNYTGYPGVFADYTFNKVKNDARHEVLWWIIKDNKNFSIVYKSRLSLDQQFLDDGLKMINSFTLPVEPENPAKVDKENNEIPEKPKRETPKLTFKIDPKYVTLPTDKDFKWYKWEKAPEDLKTATRFVHTYTNRETRKEVTLYEEISRKVGSCDAEIAFIDLNEDGIAGIAVSYGGNCCGSLGCSYDIFDNGGLLATGSDNAYGFSPARNGIKVNGKTFVKLNTNPTINADPEIAKPFAYDKAKKNENPKVKPTIPPGGGSTPFELGRILLRALQNNNKDLWVSCIHPDIDEDMRQMIVKRFDEFRDELTGRGVEHWKLTTFSRVGFQPKTENGEKVADEFFVEFNYKEFVGAFFLCAARTYQNKKYFMIVPCGGRTGLKRKGSN